MVKKLAVRSSATGTLCLFSAGCGSAGVTKCFAGLEGLGALSSALTRHIIRSRLIAGYCKRHVLLIRYLLIEGVGDRIAVSKGFGACLAAVAGIVIFCRSGAGCLGLKECIIYDFIVVNVIKKIAVGGAAARADCLSGTGCCAAGVTQGFAAFKGFCSLCAALTGLVVYSFVGTSSRSLEILLCHNDLIVYVRQSLTNCKGLFSLCAANAGKMIKCRALTACR